VTSSSEADEITMPLALFFPDPPPGAMEVAVAMKLSQAAMVALGQTVEPRVVPDPVKMGLCSPGRIPFTIGLLPESATIEPSEVTVPLGLFPRMNSRTKVSACDH